MKNSQKGSTVVVILLVIVVLLITALGFYIYSHNNQAPQQVSNSQTDIQNTEPVTTNQSSSLKTYSSSVASGGFQFSYPASYCINESNQNGTLRVVTADYSDCSSQKINNSGIPIMSVSLAPSSIKLSTLDNLAKGYTAGVKLLGDSVAKSEHITVDGQDAIRLLVNHKPNEFYAIFVIRSGRLYFITYSPYDSTVLNQVFTSLKFK